MDSDPRAQELTRRTDDHLDALLATATKQLAIAVNDRIGAQGGVPELRHPDLALDRLLAATHRATGAAVAGRLFREARAALTHRCLTLEARLAARGPLSSRSPAVRVKYRQDALRLAHTYWPLDLAAVMRAAVRIVQDLCDLLDHTSHPTQDAHRAVEQLGQRLQDMSRLPEPHRPPATLTGLDYLAAVESSLAEPAERLFYDLHNIRQLLDEELTPLISTLEGAERAYLLGLDAVAQDLIDDLTQGCDQADVLAKAVAEVEWACSDFVGADLSSAKLDGVLLKGILWDATTVWPGQWETLIRRASLPSDEEQGILIVAVEPSDSAVHVEA
ncbi:hypothetical protein [Streptomyces mirabilis]